MHYATKDVFTPPVHHVNSKHWTVTAHQRTYHVSEVYEILDNVVGHCELHTYRFQFALQRAQRHMLAQVGKCKQKIRSRLRGSILFERVQQESALLMEKSLSEEYLENIIMHKHQSCHVLQYPAIKATTDEI